MKYSLTYASAIIVLISQGLDVVGIDATVADLTVTYNTVVAILAGVLVLYGRYRVGGVTKIGTRR